MTDDDIPTLTPRKSSLVHWFEHPVDLRRWELQSVLKRKQKKAGRPRGPAREIIYNGMRYPSIRAAARAWGVSVDTITGRSLRRYYSKK